MTEAEIQAKAILSAITCQFCNGEGQLDLGEKDGKRLIRTCSPCAGTGLLHPSRLARIKRKFGIEVVDA